MPGEDHLNSIPLELPEIGKSGLVAVTVEELNDKGHNVTYHSFILLIANNDRGYTNLDKCWNPIQGRLGHIRTYRLEALVDDQLIVSKLYSSYDENLRVKPAAADGNLMCKYLIGDITPEELLASIDKRVAEEDALLRLSQLESELSQTWKVMERKDQLISHRTEEITFLDAAINGYKADIAILIQEKAVIKDELAAANEKLVERCDALQHIFDAVHGEGAFKTILLSLIHPSLLGVIMQPTNNSTIKELFEK